jgi:hypothetical protein
MTDEHQSRGAGFWATAALVVLVAYPLSSGPSFWISSRTGRGAWVVSNLYRPLFQLSYSNDDEEDGPMLKGLLWYSEICAADGWSWHSTYLFEIPGRTFPEWSWTQGPDYLGEKNSLY